MGENKMFNSGHQRFDCPVLERERPGIFVVLLGMNGTGSDKIIDPSDELYSMQLVHKAGLGLPIYIYIYTA